MPRNAHKIDLLIYAHDGRGLGHASRGIAVGAAFRRLFPQRKVLFVSGSKHTATLIGPAPLDWIKLPSYETVLVDGAPQNIAGHSNLKVKQLVESRKQLLQTIIGDLRPRCILVDHGARGKKNELVAAIEQHQDACWVLGLRSIIGKVDNIWSDETAEIFKTYYRALLWYGDETVLGRSTLQAIEASYQTRPVVTGYISRLKEMTHWLQAEEGKSKQLAGTVSVSWQNETSITVMKSLHAALSWIGDRYGQWHIYSDFGQGLFEDLPFCRVQALGPNYLYSITTSKTALIYGGYNSLSDILSVRIPAVVLLRDIIDHEQELHLNKLASLRGTSLKVVPEKKASAESLQQALETQLHAGIAEGERPDMNGAENAAKKLMELVASV